jgi:phosphate:Na+ symporter
MEQKIDDMTEIYRANQLNRMSKSSCEAQAGILYSEMLTDFERIGDHILNVGQYLSKTL